MFQRLDRASKGYITHEDLANFYKENELPVPTPQEFKLIVKPKTTYQRFLSLLLDKNHSSDYFR
jgi:Ca2+-binding EF-hand superfamily protein